MLDFVQEGEGDIECLLLGTPRDIVEEAVLGRFEAVPFGGDAPPLVLLHDFQRHFGWEHMLVGRLQEGFRS